MFILLFINHIRILNSKNISHLKKKIIQTFFKNFNYVNQLLEENVILSPLQIKLKMKKKIETKK